MKPGEIFRKKKELFFCIAAVCAGLLILTSFGKTSKSENEIEDFESYRSSTEQRLESIVGRLDGVSDVHVAVELDDSIVASSDAGSGLPVSDVSGRLPPVKGVAVVCSFGKDAVKKAEITKLICSLLGLNSTRVFVSDQ